MKNIIRIFKKDIKNIFTNWVAIIVVIALMIIPSLYSLVNIKASWDPYSNTSGIKVAIINEDKGTIFKEKEINLGKELVEKLQDNDKMGWIFVDKETGQNGLLLEEYYATIEIPEDFSENTTTLVEKNVTKPKLIYTVNEKKNAIAPKMTDAGIKTVKAQIDDNIIKTVSGLIFRICNEIGINIENNRSEFRNIIDSIYELDDNMPEFEVILDSAIDGTISISNLLEKVDEILPTVSDTIDATDDFLKSSQDFLDETQGELSNISPIIKDELVKTENILDTTSVQLANIDENILPEVAKKTLLMTSDTAKAASTSINDVKEKLKSIKKFLNKVSNIETSKPEIDEENQTPEEIAAIKDKAEKQEKLLESMKNNLKDVSKDISEIINRLDTINEELEILINRVDEELQKLDNGESLDLKNLTEIRKIVNDIHTLVAEMVDSYDSQFVPIIQKSFDSIRTISDNGFILLQQGKDILPDVANVLSIFKDTANLSNEQLVKLKDKFPDMKKKVHELASKLKDIDDEEKIDNLLDMITNNWEEQSSFMASPVEIEDNRLFPWPNYGSASTPFYTVLCLWIGGYMLSILLGTEVHKLEDGTEVKHYETYFGRMLLFLFIGIGQATIASIGALYMLGVYSVHPIMFILYTIFVSIVFIIIIYTAVSVFGNAGIIFGVVLLVIQVAGASGNFPIEVNPTIFKSIFPFLPFTYAISGMRQVMAGIVYSILLKDIFILIIFMIISLIIGISLKKATNKYNAKFVKKLKESKLANG